MKTACASEHESIMVTSFAARASGENLQECGSYPQTSPEISSSKIGSWGGARDNSGGARANSGGVRENSGGRRDGAGRKPKPMQHLAPSSICGPRWYGVETEFRAEYDVYAVLVHLGLRCHLPRFIDRTRKNRRLPRAPVIALVIPGFVLCEFDRAETPWRQITAQPGVKRLLGVSSEFPSPARIGEVERLIAMGRAGDGVIDDDATPFPTGHARAGEMVRIEEGPFTSFQGICQESSDRGLTILAEIFGRSAVVHLRHNQVSVI
jgi:transcription antitermination factor NusG